MAFQAEIGNPVDPYQQPIALSAVVFGKPAITRINQAGTPPLHATIKSLISTVIAACPEYDHHTRPASLYIGPIEISSA
jgi:hypothetical protein